MPSEPEKFMSFFPYPEFKPQQLPVMEFVSEVIEKEGIGLTVSKTPKSTPVPARDFKKIEANGRRRLPKE